MPKRFLVVGGSSGIGLDTIKKLISEGHEVINMSRTSPNLSSESLSHHSVDVLSEDNLPHLDTSLDGLVYCPGSINLKPFRSLKTTDYQKDFEINVLGAVKVIQNYLKALKEAPNSSIVLFSTVAVGTGMSFHSSVSAAKGAIEGLTRSLAAELAPSIRVNCVAPSIVDTPLASRFLSSEEKVEASAKRHPLNRVGDVNDISEAVKYLLSDSSGWVTGQILPVDGGLSSIRNL